LSKRKAEKQLTELPQYKKFVKKFRYDWLSAWLYLVPKEFWPSLQQLVMLNEVSQTGSRVSIASGHGTGKSFSSAMLVIIFMLAYPNSQIYLVANSVSQVKAAVWKNIRIVISEIKTRHPWLARHIILTESELFIRGHKGIWNCRIKSCKQGQEEGLAGEHTKHFIYIVDEASGVSDAAFKVMTGAMTEKDNRMLLLSQPTRLKGMFYRTQTTYTKRAGETTGFTPLVFNSEQSPFVDEKYLFEKAREYGGRDSEEYRIRVLGLFPDNVAGDLLSIAECTRAQRANPKLASDWGYVALVDIGDGRDKSVILIAKVSGDDFYRRLVPVKIIEYPSSIKAYEMAEHIEAECYGGIYPNITVAIDAHGIGNIVVQRMEQEFKRDVIAMKWGGSCHSDAEKKRFNHKRTQGHFRFKYAVQQGRCKLDNSDKTKEQASKLPYSMSDKGVYAMMPKPEMKKQGIPSPDRTDTYCMGMLVSYVPANIEVPDSAKKALDEAKDWLNEEAA
jgi:hypothetical protein